LYLRTGALRKYQDFPSVLSIIAPPLESPVYLKMKQIRHDFPLTKKGSIGTRPHVHFGFFKDLARIVKAINHSLTEFL